MVSRRLNNNCFKGRAQIPNMDGFLGKTFGNDRFFPPFIFGEVALCLDERIFFQKIRYVIVSSNFIIFEKNVNFRQKKN